MAHLTDNNQGQSKTTILQKISCGTGHVMNDLIRISFSYALIFMVKVAGLTGKQAGLIILITQLTDSFCGPLVGYCSDKLTLPLIARCIGRRKAWHLVGTILMAVVFSLMFTRCLICQDSSSDVVKVAYYVVILAIASIASVIIDIGHLSIIAVVAKNQEECIVLNILRTIFTYLSGICAYAVTWIILTANSETGLSEKSWVEFTTINAILAGIGLLFSGAIFHLGTREPREIGPKTKFRDLITKSGLLSVAMIFTLGTNVEEQQEMNSKRKVSFPLRKVSTFLTPLDQTIMEGSDDNITTRNEQEEASGARRISNRSIKNMSALRKMSTYLVPYETGYEYPEQHDNSSDNRDNKDTDEKKERKISLARRNKSSSVFIGLGMGHMTSFIQEEEPGELSWREAEDNQPSEHRTMVSFNDREEESYANKGFSHDLDDEKEAGDNQRSEHRTMVSFDDEEEESYANKGFSHDLNDNKGHNAEDEMHAFEDPTPRASVAPNMEGRKRASSFPAKIVDACHTDEGEGIRIPKTRKMWLKDPHLHLVCVIYTFTRLMQDAGYSYLSFYLTDYMLLSTTAIAYFPLILLASGLCGTVISKLLNGKLGSKWTYCLAEVVVIGAAVCFYLLTSNTNKAAVYASTILLGIGMSSSSVMALSLLTGLIGDNKETTGFVFSLAGFIVKLASGAYFMTVQSFFPTSGEVGTFARYVFTFSLGILAILGLIIVLFSQKSDRSERSGPDRISRVRREGVQERPSVVGAGLSLELPDNQDTWDTRM